MRIHGGYGYSTEFEIERLYRDAPLMAIGEGTNDILRVLIARALARTEVPA
jgi:alkylation response protein AidB-like acyl-CoA dehydrogenase